MDIENGHTFWDVFATDRCKSEDYSIIYEGFATRVSSKTKEIVETIYTLVSEDITFALAKRSTANICGFEIINTEHPRLTILEIKNGQSFVSKEQKQVRDLDLFTYINSKFVYVERHVRKQMQNLYLDLLRQRCELEQENFKTSLSLSQLAPDLFAYNLMKGPGYYAQLAGEVIYIIKCVPVKVLVNRGTDCYQQLRVERAGEIWFMRPKTRILTKTGIQVSCSIIMPSLYQIDGIWYKFFPRALGTIAPKMLEPSKVETWEYQSPGTLATTGIYGDKDLQVLNHNLLFPLEKDTLVNILARGSAGLEVLHQGFSIYDALDPSTLLKLAHHASSWLWTQFISLGNISSGIIGILAVLYVAQKIVNITIRGCEIYRVFGWSTRLCAALCSSLTHLCIRIGKTRKENREYE